MDGVSNYQWFGGYRYDVDRENFINSNGDVCRLRRRSFQVLRYLSQHPDKVVSKEELMQAVWENRIVTDDSLTQCISEIRKAIKDSDFSVLKTVPRRGYVLVPDIEAPACDVKLVNQTPHDESKSRWSLSPGGIKAWVVAIPLVVALAVQLLPVDHGEIPADKPIVVPVSSFSSAANVPSVSLNVTKTGNSGYMSADFLKEEIESSLLRYKTIQLVDHSEADYVITINPGSDIEETSLLVALVNNATGEIVFNEQIMIPSSENDDEVGPRVSAMIASPATGAIGRELLAKGRRKPVAELSKAECYAHGYDCTNCSGELDTVDLRAQTCLSNVLENDDKDVRAWGLQSTIYAKQYQWSTNLNEPLRTNVKLRQPIVRKALAAASHAEQLSDGNDSAVYWGLAQAYLAACDTQKMKTAMSRGLAINPKDPGLLGTFGNWMAYSGSWDEGVAMVEEALGLEPRHFKRWWLFAPAKRHYIRGEYQKALDLFQQAFNERNWLSHLQLSYTLPYLDRLEEAEEAVEKLQYVFPGVTVEVALQLYKNYCFPDEYLNKMKKGLLLAGLPERGDSTDFRNIRMPMTKIVRLDDWLVEYLDLGEGMPVIFVHGAMSDYRSWAHYQNPVSEKYRYISYSRRYHGSQPWPDAGENNLVQHHTQDLERFIESLEIDKAVLVTWSSGSPISTLLALQRPDLVAGLVLFEPNTLNLDNEADVDYPHAEKERFLSGFKRIFGYLDQGNPELATKAFMETVFENEPGEFETELMAIRRVVLDNVNSVPLRLTGDTEGEIEITCDDLAGLDVPVMVLYGENTNEFWQYRARKYDKCAPDSTIAAVPGVNHAGPIRDPKQVFSLIQQFVESKL